MRKIDKTQILATQYKIWLDKLEASNIDHGPYNSAKNPFYKDIFMNLLTCQGGVCAYTELFLCDPEEYDSAKWENGKFIGKFPLKGQLEHFDPELKNTRCWLWDNLFVSDSDINTKIKRHKQVDPILKPDDYSYDPFKLLEYDLKLHIFKPNKNIRDIETYTRIQEMLDTLGLNWDPIRDYRRKYLNEILSLVNLGFNKIDEASVYQFFTAFEMIRQQLQD